MQLPKIRGDVLSTIVTLVEWIVAALLVILAVLGTITIGASVLRLIQGGLGQSTAAFITILDATLLVFIIAELFKIALAYIRHDDVIPTVMEAALVAIARKLVVLDTHVAPAELMAHAGAYALLLVSVGVVWYLLSRTNGAWSKGEPRDPRHIGSSTDAASERPVREA